MEIGKEKLKEIIGLKIVNVRKDKDNLTIIKLENGYELIVHING